MIADGRIKSPHSAKDVDLLMRGNISCNQLGLAPRAVEVLLLIIFCNKISSLCSDEGGEQKSMQVACTNSGV